MADSRCRLKRTFLVLLVCLIGQCLLVNCASIKNNPGDDDDFSDEDSIDGILKTTTGRPIKERGAQLPSVKKSLDDEVDYEEDEKLSTSHSHGSTTTTTKVPQPKANKSNQKSDSDSGEENQSDEIDVDHKGAGSTTSKPDDDDEGSSRPASGASSSKRPDPNQAHGSGEKEEDDDISEKGESRLGLEDGFEHRAQFGFRVGGKSRSGYADEEKTGENTAKGFHLWGKKETTTTRLPMVPTVRTTVPSNGTTKASIIKLDTGGSPNSTTVVPLFLNQTTPRPCWCATSVAPLLNQTNNPNSTQMAHNMQPGMNNTTTTTLPPSTSASPSISTTANPEKRHITTTKQPDPLISNNTTSEKPGTRRPPFGMPDTAHRPELTNASISSTTMQPNLLISGTKPATTSQKPNSSTQSPTLSPTSTTTKKPVSTTKRTDNKGDDLWVTEWPPKKNIAAEATTTTTGKPSTPSSTNQTTTIKPDSASTTTSTPGKSVSTLTSNVTTNAEPSKTTPGPESTTVQPKLSTTAPRNVTMEPSTASPCPKRECLCDYKDLKDSDKLLAVVSTDKGGFKGRRISTKEVSSMIKTQTSSSNKTVISSIFPNTSNDSFVFPPGHYYFPHPIRFVGFSSP